MALRCHRRSRSRARGRSRAGRAGNRCSSKLTSSGTISSAAVEPVGGASSRSVTVPHRREGRHLTGTATGAVDRNLRKATYSETSRSAANGPCCFPQWRKLPRWREIECENAGDDQGHSDHERAPQSFTKIPPIPPCPRVVVLLIVAPAKMTASARSRPRVVRLPVVTNSRSVTNTGTVPGTSSPVRPALVSRAPRQTRGSEATRPRGGARSSGSLRHTRPSSCGGYPSLVAARSDHQSRNSSPGEWPSDESRVG